MEKSKKNILNDVEFYFWGGNVYDGLSKNNTLCAGYTVLAGYIDKKLGPFLRKKFEDHMASCRECREDVREIRMMLKAINN